ncbi:MAG TPA: nucleoside-diphosphate kinase [Dissulfurispiraceae bacterium]|nr:nucleoside-diphosphate kinase [Dissulfurispiraceae bacterium]
MEQTLSIIKPDAVKKNVIGQIISRFEQNDLRIVAMKRIQLSKAEAEGFYYVHKERPFFDSLTTFMSEGPIVVMVLEGEDAVAKNRALMGATNPANAETGTIRKDFADDIEHNAVHGSDSAESAAFEILYFFSGMEIR